ncbi:MAG: S46 family peptidase [Bryobacteraceae bacterium]
MRFRGLLLIGALCLPLTADEGMWLFNQFPKDKVKEKYEFDVTDGFLDHLRLSTLRIGSGTGAGTGAGTGSFVSPTGLVLTNQRLVADCLKAAAGHDYLKDGFYAATPQEELACPNLDAAVVVSMEDVTKQVKESAKEGAKPAEALAKRNAASAAIEKACAERTHNTCTVVKLSSGERYDLYQYKKYSDVRLVFAPESAIALFGGAAADYTFQRYSLDVAFLRAYENGKPVATPQYLKWSTEGVTDTALSFAAGNPAPTSRLATVAQLTFYHDTMLPAMRARIQWRLLDLRNFAARSEANLAIATRHVGDLNTSYKFTAGRLIGLDDVRLMARKANFEKKLRAAVEHDPKLGTEGGKVWDEVATAYTNWKHSERTYEVLERPGAIGSDLFRIARQIVRLSEERAKPNEQRLPEYRDGNLASLEASLYSPAPIDDPIEALMLARYLEEIKSLGEREVPVKAIFGSRTPTQAAEEYLRNTKLKDVAERKRLAGDRAAVQKSEDGMIRLAKLLDEPARKLLKKREETIETLEVSSAEKIAQYRFKMFGAADYPDATSTLRLTFGAVKDYKDRTEAKVLYDTTYGGLFYLAGKNVPLLLPQRWMDAKGSLDLVTPYDFPTTCDIAGSAGSPTVDKKGELIGIVVDGNLESIALTYLYTDETARAVHVATQGIAEALRTVYKTTALLHELGVPETKKSGTE